MGDRKIFLSSIFLSNAFGQCLKVTHRYLQITYRNGCPFAAHL